MTASPLISVITVVYNGAQFLEETILSVINQTYPNLEYIIIDGGSSDGSVDIIKKYEDKIAYWVSEPDRGIYDAMNKGITKAHGEWINFMNASDTFYSHETLERIFSSTFLTDVIAGAYQLKGTKEGLYFPLQILDLVAYGELLSCHQALFFNKNTLSTEIYYDTRYKINADNDIMMRLCNAKYKIGFTNEIVAVFDTTGISSRKPKGFIPEKYKIIYKNFGFMGVVKAIIYNRILR